MWYVLNLPWDHVVKGHVTQWLHAISSLPWNLVWISFLKLWRNGKKIGNTKLGSSKNETKNSYYKVVTKCDRSLLQSASGIIKCERLLLQSASRITKCAVVTKWGVTPVTVLLVLSWVKKIQVSLW